LWLCTLYLANAIFHIAVCIAFYRENQGLAIFGVIFGLVACFYLVKLLGLHVWLIRHDLKTNESLKPGRQQDSKRTLRPWSEVLKAFFKFKTKRSLLTPDLLQGSVNLEQECARQGHEYSLKFRDRIKRLCPSKAPIKSYQLANDNSFDLTSSRAESPLPNSRMQHSHQRKFSAHESIF
jgi:hypothetical protein